MPERERSLRGSFAAQREWTGGSPDRPSLSRYRNSRVNLLQARCAHRSQAERASACRTALCSAKSCFTGHSELLKVAEAAEHGHGYLLFGAAGEGARRQRGGVSPP